MCYLEAGGNCSFLGLLGQEIITGSARLQVRTPAFTVDSNWGQSLSLAIPTFSPGSSGIAYLVEIGGKSPPSFVFLAGMGLWFLPSLGLACD